jgi:hypothetical protein
VVVLLIEERVVFINFAQKSAGICMAGKGSQKVRFPLFVSAVKSLKHLHLR